MRRFIVNVCAFVICVLLLVAFFFLVLSPLIPFDLRSFEKLAAKVSRLEERPEGKPLFVLVGGSSLYYGIEDELLYAALSNRFHVVNMGFHAGLGLGRMLEVVAPHLEDGDVVCLAAEYSHFTGDGYSGGCVAIIHAIDFSRMPFGVLFAQRYAGFPQKGWGQYFDGKVKNILVRRNHGGSGLDDLTTVPQVPSAEMVNSHFECGSPWQLHEKSFAYLKRFVDDMHGRGVRTVFSSPAYDARLFELHRGEISAIGRRLESLGVERISNEADYAYPIELLYDSNYHLNSLGRTNRTERLIKDIDAFIRRSSPTPSE